MKLRLTSQMRASHTGSYRLTFGKKPQIYPHDLQKNRKRFRGLTLLRNPEWLPCGWCRDCWVWAYEGMFLLDSTKAAAAWDDTIKHVHDILTKHNSEIVASRKKATYLLTYFKTDGTKLKDIVADCHLSDLILRELILKVHPKLEVQLVNQAMTSTPNAEAEEASGYDDELDERPRRRRRDE